ncbi:MAG: CPBP family intramembrane metalloprotease [Clostridia bacterium]|nr:CPBP family intramembrane metalloprotease [Clostridia bacterium]
MTPRRELWKDGLLAITAMLICVYLYHIAKDILDIAVSDSFLSDFLAELVFAVLAMASVLLLKQTALFHSDVSLLKKGWLSAGLEIAAILYFGLTDIPLMLEATATPPQWLCLLGQAVLVGFCEEVLFRGLIQRAMHRRLGEDSFGHVFLAIFCSGVLFGLAHLINTDRGNGLLPAVFQAGVNACMGMYYGAVYFRTGKNIWYMIVLHSLYDLTLLIANGRLSGRTVNSILNFGGGELTPKLVLIGILAWGAIYLLPTLFILRPKKLKPLLAEKKD